MYSTSDNYKNTIYQDSTKHLLRVFIDEIEVEPKYILEFSSSYSLFDNDEFCLGSVCARTVSLKLYKEAVLGECNVIKITTGIEGEEIPFRRISCR